MNLQTMIRETIETIEREMQETETLLYQIVKELYAAEASQDQGSEQLNNSSTLTKEKIGSLNDFSWHHFVS